MDNNKLQAEFTNWLDTLAYRTKLNYIRDEKKHRFLDSIDEIQEDRLLIEDSEQTFLGESMCGFRFSVDWLENAFTELSEVSKKILYLHIIEERQLTEIADIIGYSYRHTKRLYALSIEAIKIYKEKHYGN